MDKYSIIWAQAAQELFYAQSSEYVILKLPKHKDVPDSWTVSGKFDAFLGQLPKSDCRYALLAFFDEPVDGWSRAKYCFVSWLPEDAPAETAVRYHFHQADLFDSLCEVLHNGFQHVAKTVAKIEARYYDDLAYEAVLDQVNRQIES
ncbi:cofilin family protein [Nocardia sputi]|uniref:cofilin family protein n=1 Tax=Nocardia sputi TaxID=2943705 RepID=UPI0020C164FE|nr:cofilin family protein [Nocardia sputi]